jgi:hypothetical protein
VAGEGEDGHVAARLGNAFDGRFWKLADHRPF